MAFKIQDLMSDVLPEPARWAQGCPGGLTCAGGGGFAAISSTGKDEKSPKCRPASCGTSPKPNPDPNPGGNLPQPYTALALLQRQLRQTLDGPRA